MLTSDSEVDAGDGTIADYIKTAKRKKKELQRKPRKKRKRASIEEEIEEQMMIHVGRMMHSNKRKKGILVAHVTPRQIMLHKNCTYKHMLERCRQEVYPDEDGADFYVANSTGACIASGDTITMDRSDGTVQTVPWTLQTYLMCARKKYPSRARFYCVKKVHGEDDEPMAEMGAATAPEGNEVCNTNTASDVQVTGNADASIGDGDNPNREFINIKDNDVLQLNLCAFSSGVSGGRECRDFQPLFAMVTKCRHADKFIFRLNITQTRALMLHARENPELRDIIDECDDEDKLSVMNPCNMDFQFHGVQMRGMLHTLQAKGATLSLEHDLDMDNGRLCFGKPYEGEDLTIWSGGYACNNSGVAVMVCCALAGHHSISTYTWHLNNTLLVGESYAVLYTDRVGVYKCTITNTLGAVKTHIFEVIGDQESGIPQLVLTKPHESEGVTAAAIQLCTHSRLLSLKAEKDRIIENCAGFQLLGLIGQGSFGAVYRAVWHSTVIAAKVVSIPMCVGDAIEQEVAVCRKIHHPNLIQFLGTEKDASKSTVTILMNYVDGPNLNNLIFDTRFKKMDDSAKFFVAVQICQALNYLHTSKPVLMHLDVKPSNIMVELPSYRATLGDFGLSKIASSTGTVGSKTMLAGSPGFQAPEQLSGSHVGVESDIYAFGGVMIVLFGERPVWPGLNPYQIMFAVSIEKRVPQTDDISPDVISTVCKNCFQDVGNRVNAIWLLKTLL